MIVLFTDFGRDGPYIGQMQAVLHHEAPGIPVIDLFADVPAYDVRAGAYLLPAYASEFAGGTVFVCVVDPGVGGTRDPLIVKADGRWYVGPGNGLFELVRRRSTEFQCWTVTWSPARLSASFHGRDLFVPVAAQLANGRPPPGTPCDPSRYAQTAWPDDLAEVIYVDGFGNAMTGLRAETVATTAGLAVGSTVLTRARTFSDVPVGQAFWYENANGLAEIAVNQGHAAAQLGIRPGTPVTLT